MTDTLLIATDARGVATVTLNRPEIHNAFDDRLIAELTQTLERLESDSRVRVVVLTGAGKSFSAGADLNWMKRMALYSAEQNRRDAEALAKLMRTLDRLAKPTIAQVQGAAIAGGCGLVACCDVALASERATFAISEVRLGLIPAVISPYVVAAIGERNARRYFLTAEVFDARSAEQMGLVHGVFRVDPAAAAQTAPDALRTAVDQLCDVLIANGPAAMAAAKTMIRDVARTRCSPRSSSPTAARSPAGDSHAPRALGIAPSPSIPTPTRDALHVRERRRGGPIGRRRRARATCAASAIVEAARAAARRRSIPATGSCPRTPTSPRPVPPPARLHRARRRRDRARWATSRAAKALMEKAGVPVVPGLSRRGPATACCSPSMAGASATRCWSRRPPAAAARACGRRPRRTSEPKALAGASARRAPSATPRAGRERLSRAAAARRGAGVRRRARQRRASVRARLLAAAPAPEGGRGGAGARHDARARARSARPRCARREPSNYAGAGTVEFMPMPDGELLLHGDEHAPAGRASGHRDDHRARPRRVAAARRGGRAAAAAQSGSRRTATRSKCGSTPRIRARLPAGDGALAHLRFPAGHVRRCGRARVDTGVAACGTATGPPRCGAWGDALRCRSRASTTIR
jgi:methylglutaconyl-CoA hydratase